MTADHLASEVDELIGSIEGRIHYHSAQVASATAFEPGGSRRAGARADPAAVHPHVAVWRIRARAVEDGQVGVPGGSASACGVCALAAFLAAACGSDSDPPPPPAAPPSAEVAAQGLRCGEYRQNAGGYGGGTEREVLKRIETRGRLAPVDGAVPVELTSLLTEPCTGAVLIFGSSRDFVEVRRSDSHVEGGASAAIAVPMTAEAIAALERSGGRVRLHITAEYRDRSCPPEIILPCTPDRDVVIDAGS